MNEPQFPIQKSRAGFFFRGKKMSAGRQPLRIRWAAAQLAQSQEEARRLVKCPRLVFFDFAAVFGRVC